ncbi:hypothetical protein Micbo1qcDRAFT_199637 [Microdochium bolleyi]|uniref:Mid2 domain-containing protein n=1 Tax=Microdochium bolleyi TaxID=196109 RepID=A0A136JIA9_9PEZI|nr:hypothetical protein Micbo1qcDRAFT_199637 [Microdochium bolleyi]
MRSPLFVTACAVAIHAFVLDGRLPRETDASRILDEPQQPAITTPPSVKELVRRAAGVNTFLLASNNICGYIDGYAANPYSCVNSAATCAIFTTSGGGVPACCVSAGCEFATACVDSAAVSGTNPICTGKCLTETKTLKCTGTSFPYCGTLTFFSGVSDYYCVNNNRSTVQKVETTYSGQIGGGFFPVELTLTDTTSSRSSSSYSSSTGSSSSTATASSTTSGTPAASADNGNSGSSAPIGAIVGGAVGGVALLAAIAFGLWFVRRHSRNKAGAIPATAGSADQSAPGAPGGQSPQPMAAVPGQQYPPSPYFAAASPAPTHAGLNGGQPYYHGQEKLAGFVSVSPNATGVVSDRNMNMSPMSVATELDNNPATIVHEMSGSPAVRTEAHELA